MYTNDVKLVLLVSNVRNSGTVYINPLIFDKSYNDAVCNKLLYQLLKIELVVEVNAYGLVLVVFGTGCM